MAKAAGAVGAYLSVQNDITDQVIALLAHISDVFGEGCRRDAGVSQAAAVGAYLSVQNDITDQVKCFTCSR